MDEPNYTLIAIETDTDNKIIYIQGMVEQIIPTQTISEELGLPSLQEIDI